MARGAWNGGKRDEDDNVRFANCLERSERNGGGAFCPPAVFEHSPWVASAAFARRPFENLAELHEAMMGAVLSSSDDTVLQFLCAHPELAGREMQEGKLTENSSLEQARAGLDALTP